MDETVEAVESTPAATADNLDSGTAALTPDDSGGDPSPSGKTAAPSSGPERGADGRFTAKSRSTPEGEEGDEVGAITPDGEQPPAEAQEEPEKQPEAPAGEPYTYTARGAKHTIEGAVVIPGEGLRVPEASIPRLEAIIRTAHEHGPARRELQRAQRQIEELSTKVNERSEFSKRAAEGYLAAARLVETDPDAAWQALVGFAKNLPVLRAKAEADEARAELEALRRGRQPDPEEVAEAEGQKQLEFFRDY